MLKKQVIRTIVIFVALAASLLVAAPAARAADGQLRLIRDAEIENIIRLYAAPVFKSAGVDPKAIKVHLIHDPRLNAFVAGGLNMFINTGLLIRTEHAGQVIGVMAHETGHIAGGHLARMRQSLEDAQTQSIVAFLLGAAAGILAQDSRAAIAVMSLGLKAAEGGLLRFSRGQESAADQFAVAALDSAKISSRGFMEFLQILQGQEFLVTAQQSPYQRTHPVTSSRVEFARNHLANSPFADAVLPAKFAVMHARMRAKLAGFLEYPLHVLAGYGKNDRSVPARYARAIAYHRDAKMMRSIKLIDELIAEAPKDPYFRELKGQVLFENGRVSAAVVAYRDSVRLLPDAPLIRASLGQALLETTDPGAPKEALVHLLEAVRGENRNPAFWRFLGIAYGRSGKLGLSSLAMAESGLLISDLRLVRSHVERAERHLAKGTPAWRRLQDIRRVAEQAAAKQDRFTE